MILENLASKVETNVDNSHRLTFKNTPKLFSLLSDNLYSNKIGSIIRELTSNARDSHIEAKNPNPFDIHLPTYLNPVFKIRDYGVGMSKRQIYEVFSCYGESTKTDSNDVIGAFGLGSKTPLSYCESFNIVSIFDNVKTNYIVYIDSEGYPTITEMSEINTIEKNGFEIFFAVEEKDFYTFEIERKDQLKYFDFNYNLNDRLVNKFQFNNSIFKNDLGVVVSENSRSNVKVLFGGICYETDIHHESFEIILKFNIGDLDVSVSREQLALTEKTKTAIQEKFEKFEVDFIEHVWNDFSHITHTFDFEHQFVQKYGVSFARKSLNVNTLRSINVQQYNFLKVYSDGKKVKHLKINIRFPLSFRIYDKKDRVNIKDILSYYNDFIVVDFKNYAESKKQLNQFLMEYDTQTFLKYFTNDEIEKFKSVKQEKEELYGCSIKRTGTFTTNFSLDNFYRPGCTKYIYFIKHKNNIVDENDQIIFTSNHFDMLKDDFVGSDVFIVVVTKPMFKKLKSSDQFKNFESGIDYVKNFLSGYNGYISSTKIIYNKDFYLRNKDKIDDKDFIEFLEQKQMSYQLSNYLRSYNHIWKISVDFSDNSMYYEKYKLLENMTMYNDKQDEIINIINFIHKRSLKND